MRPGIASTVALVVALAGCGAEPQERSYAGGRAETGAELIRHYGCGSCHHIPGIASADGNVGPPLDGIAARAYLGGVVPNHFETMVKWLLGPRQFDPLSAMPDVGLDEQQARDIAAYLYTMQTD